jgi:hypothetical protein
MQGSDKGSRYREEVLRGAGMEGRGVLKGAGIRGRGVKMYIHMMY